MGDTISADGFEFTVDEEMCAAVFTYIEHIDALRVEAGAGSKMHVEVNLTPALKKLHPELGGTADCVIWSPKFKVLYVDDYKHGAGVYVEVDNNRQLMYYALGALLAYPEYKAQEVVITITQPRCQGEPVRKYGFDAFDLIAFGAELVLAAKATEAPDAPLVPGKTQCQWCDARATCPALEKASTAMIEADFEKSLVDPDALSRAMSIVPAVEARCKEIRSIVYGLLTKGGEVPGFKLVAKRGKRYWTAPDTVETMVDLMDERDTFYDKPEMKSLAAIEKMMGKAEFADTFGDLTEMRSTGYNLVEDGDSRPSAVGATETDFVK